MKIILLTINLMLLALGILSQEYHEMPKFTASKELQIQNSLQQGRDKIIADIVATNHKDAIGTLKQLIKKYGDHYIILYPREEIMVALATRNFETFVDSALHYDPVIAKNKKAFVFNDFRNDLYKYMLPEIALITDELDKNKLPEKEKAIVRIYIHFLYSNNISLLNKEIRKYKKNYSRTLYNDFLNSLKRITINSRINFSAGYSSDLIGGKISNSYYNRLSNSKIELDGFIRQTYISLFVGGGFSNVSTAHSFRNENNSLFIVAGEKVSSQKYGFKLGKVFYSSDKIKLYPYISVGRFEVRPPTVLYESNEVLSRDLLQISSFLGGLGVSCDILLKKWKPKNMYDPEGYFFIRPNIGYDRLITETKISKPNNLYFSVSLGVGIGPKR